MTSESGKVPGSGRPGGEHSASSDLRKALVAVPAMIVMPFVMLYRALRDIWSDRASRGILIAAAIVLAAGTIIFMIIEDFSMLDSFYFSFITLATIGYGDFSPQTDLGKVVTIIYGIVGLGIMAALISTIASQGLAARRASRAGGSASSDGDAS